MKYVLLSFFIITYGTSSWAMDTQPKQLNIPQQKDTAPQLPTKHNKNKKCCQRPIEIAKTVVNNPLIMVPIATRVVGVVFKLITRS